LDRGFETRVKKNDATCRSCGVPGLDLFHELDRVPVYACHLPTSREEALRVPTGSLRLGFCPSCGFIQNTAFDPRLVDYTQSYEDSQAYSPRFREFARGLAKRLVETYDLHDKDVLEIGCGKGDFLGILCEMGPKRGIGIDPAYRPGRLASEALGRIEFVPEFWDAERGALGADLVCCRHTLEHLCEPRAFVSQVRAALEDRPETIVFFEVPDVARVIDEVAFWDLYYEHCSYFSLGSLARLFRACGFEILRLERDFGDQYLLLDARPNGSAEEAPLPGERDLEALHASVRRFARELGRTLESWSGRFSEARRRGERVVVWGGGSKTVGFLNALDIGDAVDCVVDINPHKQGLFLPGTGQEIVRPESLESRRPDLVVVMNPLYVDEIRDRLAQLSLSPKVVAA